MKQCDHATFALDLMKLTEGVQSERFRRVAWALSVSLEQTEMLGCDIVPKVVKARHDGWVRPLAQEISASSFEVTQPLLRFLPSLVAAAQHRREMVAMFLK